MPPVYGLQSNSIPIYHLPSSADAVLPLPSSALITIYALIAKALKSAKAIIPKKLAANLKNVLVKSRRIPSLCM